jgi:hypothetical protein
MALPLPPDLASRDNKSYFERLFLSGTSPNAAGWVTDAQTR